MPYIEKERRKKFDKHISILKSYVASDDQDRSEAEIARFTIAKLIKNAGDLNYVLSKTFVQLFNENKRYSTADWIMGVLTELEHRIADPGILITTSKAGDKLYPILRYLRDEENSYGIIGTLRCVQLEFYTRFVRPYEDEKIKENGDIV